MQTPPPPFQPPPYAYGPSQPPPRQKMTAGLLALIIGGVAVIVCCPILAAVLFPVFSQARTASQRMETKRHMEIIASAFSSYLKDHGHTPDMLSPEITKMMLASSLGGQDTSNTMFTDLHTKKPLAVNGLLSHVSVKDIKDPSRAVLMYQPEVDNGRRYVIFADGMVERVDEATFQQDLLSERPSKTVVGALAGKWKDEQDGSILEIKEDGSTTLWLKDKDKTQKSVGKSTLDRSDFLMFKSASGAEYSGIVTWRREDAIAVMHDASVGTDTFVRVKD